MSNKSKLPCGKFLIDNQTTLGCLNNSHNIELDKGLIMSGALMLDLNLRSPIEYYNQLNSLDIEITYLVAYGLVSKQPMPFIKPTDVLKLCAISESKYTSIVEDFIINEVIPFINKNKLRHDEEKTIMTTNQLINIQAQQIGNETVNAVSARELHKFLESKREFTHWVKPYVSEDNAYGFVQGTDFIRFDGSVNPTNNVPTIDYWFTMDMAKEVSMLSKTEKGKQARKYFIDCERRANNPANALPNFANPAEAAIAWANQYKEKEQLDIELKAKEQILEEAKPLIGFAETAQKADNGILIRDLAYLAQNDGIKIGEKRLYNWFRMMGFIHKNGTRPIQTYIERGYFVMQATFIQRTDGMKEQFTTKVTGKGQVYFLQKLKDYFQKGNYEQNCVPTV